MVWPGQATGMCLHSQIYHTIAVCIRNEAADRTCTVSRFFFILKEHLRTRTFQKTCWAFTLQLSYNRKVQVGCASRVPNFGMLNRDCKSRSRVRHCWGLLLVLVATETIRSSCYERYVHCQSYTTPPTDATKDHVAMIAVLPFATRRFSC